MENQLTDCPKSKDMQCLSAGEMERGRCPELGFHKCFLVETALLCCFMVKVKCFESRQVAACRAYLHGRFFLPLTFSVWHQLLPPGQVTSCQLLSLGCTWAAFHTLPASRKQPRHSGSNKRLPCKAARHSADSRLLGFSLGVQKAILIQSL